MTISIPTPQDTCPDSLAVVVGNKADLDDERRVSKAEGASYAESEGLPFFEVSAKSGLLITDVFALVAQTLVDRKRAMRG